MRIKQLQFYKRLKDISLIQKYSSYDFSTGKTFWDDECILSAICNISDQLNGGTRSDCHVSNEYILNINSSLVMLIKQLFLLIADNNIN